MRGAGPGVGPRLALAAWTNQRTPRCSAPVSSQLVVKATGALKISFKEPPSGGAQSCYDNRASGDRRACLPLPQPRALGGGDAPSAAALQVGSPPSPTPHHVSASVSLCVGRPAPCPQESLRTPKPMKVLTFCPFAKDVKNSLKQEKCKISPIHGFEMPAVVV